MSATSETPTPPAAEPAPEPPSSKPTAGMSSGRRVAIGVNVVTQIVIIFAILGFINFVSYRHFKRWDLSRNQTFALSSQTRNVVGNLSKPVKAIVYFSGGLYGQIYPDTIGLLREYEYNSKGKLTVEEVDPYRNLQRANELIERYKIGEVENIVILDYEGKSKFVEAKDMADLDMSGIMQQQTPTVKAFKGESVVTSALMELVEGKPQKLYLTEGHGEPPITAEGSGKGDDVSIIGEMYKRSNIKYERLSLMDAERIPEDATALMIFGARQDFTDREIGLLDAYWKAKGRVFVLIRPSAKTPRLKEWLASNGIVPLDGRILALVEGVTASRERIRQAIGYGAGKYTNNEKKITGELSGQIAELMGTTTGLDIDKVKETTDRLRFNVLIESAKQYWNDLDPFDDQTTPSRDPAREREGPFNLAVSVEKGGLEGIKVDTSRMVVVGNCDFLTDGGISNVNSGLDFALGATNWLLNREQTVGTGIPPKEKKLVALSLDEHALLNLALWVMLTLPGIVAFFGITTWFQRRR